MSGGVTAAALFFNAGGYTLQGGTISISPTTSANTFLTYESGSGANTVSSAISLNVTGAAQYYIRNKTASTLTISGDILATTSGSGSNYLALQQNNADGTIILSGAVSAAAGTNLGLSFGTQTGGSASAVYKVSGSNTLNIDSQIARGTVLVENDNAFRGSTSIAVGTAAASAGETARLLTNGAYTIAQTINLSGGSGKSLARVIGGNSSDNSVFSGAVDFFATTTETVQLTAATGGRVDFSGEIKESYGGTGAVEKIGAGVVRLTRASGNSYKGGTTVSAGTLLLMNTGSTTSATGTGGVSIKDGATLGGTGYASGLVTASGTTGNSRFAPGDTNSIGVLHLKGGLAAPTGLTFDYQISGSSIDQVDFASGALTLNGNVTFNFTSLGTVLTGSAYSLFTGTGSWTGDESSGLSFHFVGPTGYVMDTSYGGGDGYIWDTTTHTLSVQFAAVPEPGAMGMLSLAIGLSLLFVRKKSLFTHDT